MSPLAPRRWTRAAALFSATVASLTVLGACDGSSATKETLGTATPGTAVRPAPALPDPIPVTVEVLDSFVPHDSVPTDECVRLPPLAMGESPADGSGSTNVLAAPGIVRSELRSNLAGGGRQDGVELTVTLFISDAKCQPLAGAAVYLWHANGRGEFSLSDASPALRQSTWLRGVQISDRDGKVVFHTIVPGRSSDAAAHFNLAVYSDNTYRRRLLSTRLGFADDELDSVYGAHRAYASVVESGLLSVSDPRLRDPAQILELFPVDDLTNDTTPIVEGTGGPPPPLSSFATSLMLSVPG